MKKFIKDWMLVIAIVSGAAAYLVYHAIPALSPAGAVLLPFCKIVQPSLLFLMLFLSFCSVKPSDLRLYKWQVPALLVQAVFFIVTVIFLWLVPAAGAKPALASFALCMICPTATACAVVAAKLGGDKAAVLTYTMLVNLLAAVLIPLFLPLIYPGGSGGFLTDFTRILARVFPLLILPCLAAWGVRYCLPKLHAILLKFKELPFYMWAVSLTLAIVMGTRAIVQGNAGAAVLAQIMAGSLVSCAMQFYIGRRIGAGHGVTVTCGQVMGQKNTVFAMWVAYTFMDPVISLAGGFYSIWHNCYNTWQLHRREKGR